MARFPVGSARHRFCNSPQVSTHPRWAPYNPKPTTPSNYHVAPVNSKSSNLCHTHRRPNCAALLTPTLRRTNRLASIIICFSQFKRFHRFSDNERPDRRGRIRSITERLWLVRSSPCRLPWACLAVGLPWNRQGGILVSTAFPCSALTTRWVRSTLYTGGATFASGHVRKPEPDRVPFWSKP
jgi:hypothetical protein